MTKVCSRESDFYKVQAVLANQLRTLWVSHEEVYKPDERDGDLVDEDSVMLITGLIDQKIEKGCFIDPENKNPRIILHKDVVVPVTEEEV